MRELTEDDVGLIIQYLHKMNAEFNLGYPTDQISDWTLEDRLFASIGLDVGGWCTDGGILLFNTAQNLFSGRHELHELVLYVLPDFRRTSTGYQLVKELVRYAEQQQADVIAGSITGLGWPLYKRLGFRQFGTTFKKGA